MRLALRALGIEVVVEVEGLSAAQFDELARSWGGTSVDQPGQSAVVIRARLGDWGDGDDFGADTFERFADRVSTHVTLRAIVARKHDLVMLHAGAVADPATGAVVAFLGPSGRGKTTASIALGPHFSYVTDETVGIQDDLVVVPYRKPLSMKRDGVRWKAQVAPGDLGLLPLPNAPLRLARILLLDRDPEYPADAPPKVEAVGLAEAMGELVPQISYLTERAAPLHRLRDLVAASGGLLRVTYREAHTLVPIVADLMARPAEPFGPPALEVPVSGKGPITRTAVTDSIADGDAQVVLADGTVRVLTGIAPTLWRALPAERESLVAAVVAEHGLPPDGDAGELIAAVIAELEAIGLVAIANGHLNE